MRKSLMTFVREHRTDIDATIRRGGYRGSVNDEDRRQWVLNDEGLYTWAQREGVQI